MKNMSVLDFLKSEWEQATLRDWITLGVYTTALDMAFGGGKAGILAVAGVCAFAAAATYATRVFMPSQQPPSQTIG